jgi:hypothetical protein
MTFRHKQTGCKPLHVYICTPAYNGQVDSDYAQSLAETAFCCPMYNIQITAGRDRQRRLYRARAQHVREEVLGREQGLHASDVHRRRLEIRVARFVGLRAFWAADLRWALSPPASEGRLPAQAHREPERRRPLVRQRLAAMRSRADGLSVHLAVACSRKWRPKRRAWKSPTRRAACRGCSIFKKEAGESDGRAADCKDLRRGPALMAKGEDPMGAFRSSARTTRSRTSMSRSTASRSRCGRTSTLAITASRATSGTT